MNFLGECNKDFFFDTDIDRKNCEMREIARLSDCVFPFIPRSFEYFVVFYVLLSGGVSFRMK